MLSLYLIQNESKAEKALREGLIKASVAIAKAGMPFCWGDPFKIATLDNLREMVKEDSRLKLDEDTGTLFMEAWIDPAMPQAGSIVGLA